MSVGWQPRPKGALRLLQRKTPAVMWGRTIVGRFREPMAMDISRDLRLRPVVIPPWSKGAGSPDHVFMEEPSLSGASPLVIFNPAANRGHMQHLRELVRRRV